MELTMATIEKMIEAINVASDMFDDLDRRISALEKKINREQRINPNGWECPMCGSLDIIVRGGRISRCLACEEKKAS